MLGCKGFGVKFVLAVVVVLVMMVILGSRWIFGVGVVFLFIASTLHAFQVHCFLIPLCLDIVFVNFKYCLHKHPQTVFIAFGISGVHPNRYIV